jgi:large subunit ribosomal protein L20
MPRVRKGSARTQKHKKVLKAASGFHGVNSRHYRVAAGKVFRAGCMATTARKIRKRDFRSLWITRISAACRQRGIRYSQLIGAMADKLIMLNRKMLSEIAIAEPAAFDAICVEALGEDAITKTA